MRRTLADAKASRIPAALGMCGTEQRFIDLLNEAQERLLTTGNWWGTFARYRCQASSGVLVWPRGVAAIQAVAVSSQPIRNRDIYFEFLELGPGIQDSDCSCMEGMVDRQNTPVFQQMTGVDSKVKVYSDLTADVGTNVLLLGYDENGEWIRTVQGGVYADGEVVAASAAGTLSTNKFSLITGIQKPVTNGTIRLYSYDTVTTAQYLVVNIQYDDINPSFRTSFIPALTQYASSTNTINVDVAVKLDFIPARKDTDYLIIQCLPALKDMMVAIALSEKEPTVDRKAAALNAGFATAIPALEFELRHYKGVVADVVQVQGSAGPNMEPIYSIV